MGVVMCLMFLAVFAGVVLMGGSSADYEDDLDGVCESPEERRLRLKHEKWARTDAFTDIQRRFR